MIGRFNAGVKGKRACSSPNRNGRSAGALGSRPSGRLAKRPAIRSMGIGRRWAHPPFGGLLLSRGGRRWLLMVPLLMPAASGRYSTTPCCLVLYAFRYHGVYRWYREARRSSSVRCVLNAFRHHGVYRSSAAIGSKRTQRCSTPLGITEYIGLFLNPVLNLSLVLCSTPLGITEYIGFADPVEAPHVRVCSTPLGITEYIGGRQPAWSNGHFLMCSTPLGITEYIGRQTRFQRLAGFLCSTPLGITEYIGSPTTSRTAPTTSVLNASRHHGVYRTPSLHRSSRP